jgi:hypothetical protein
LYHNFSGGSSIPGDGTRFPAVSRRKNSFSEKMLLRNVSHNADVTFINRSYFKGFTHSPRSFQHGYVNRNPSEKVRIRQKVI